MCEGSIRVRVVCVSRVPVGFGWVGLLRRWNSIHIRTLAVTKIPSNRELHARSNRSVCDKRRPPPFFTRFAASSEASVCPFSALYTFSERTCSLGCLRCVWVTSTWPKPFNSHTDTRIFGSIVKCWLACAWTTILVLVQVCKCTSLTTVRRIDCQATNHRRHRESDRVLYGIRETHTHRHRHIHIQRPTAVEYQFHGWVCFESDRGIQRTLARTHTQTQTLALERTIVHASGAYLHAIIIDFNVAGAYTGKSAHTQTHTLTHTLYTQRWNHKSNNWPVNPRHCTACT